MKSSSILRWVNHFKAAAAITLALAVAVIGLGLYWLNSHGFEGRWSERIANELARKGIHAEFESVRFSPTKGVIATHLRIFTDASHKTVVAKIPTLRFDVDRGKAFRGKLQIRRAFLHDAEMIIPVSSGETLRIEDFTGRISVDRHNRLLVETSGGLLRGIGITADITLDDFDLEKLRKGTGPDEGRDRRTSFTKDLLRELDEWSLPHDSPPALKLKVKGSFDRPTAIRTSISLRSREMMRGNYRIQDVRLSGELGNRSLNVEELSFSDRAGKLTLRAHYDLEDRTGGYEGVSSIQIADLLREGLKDDSLREFTFASSPEIKARGRFSIQDKNMSLSAIGSLSCKSFRFLEVPFEGIDTSFSWQNGDVYLRDLIVKHESGEMAGEVRVKDDLVQYRTQTSLPLSVYRPFITENSGLDRALTESEFGENSRIEIDARGSVWRQDLSDWDATGDFRIENFSHNGVPIKLATAKFSMSPLDYIFDEVRATFDSPDNSKDPRAEGDATGTLRVEQVHFDAKEQLTHLLNLEGTAWPGPILQIFSPKSSEHVTETYRFGKPPYLAATGVIDHLDPGNRTDVHTIIKTTGETELDLMGRSLPISQLSAKIRSRYRKNEISDLKMNVFGGSISGEVTHQSHPSRLGVRIQAEGMDAARLGRTFRFGEVVPGALTFSIAAEATKQRGGSDDGQWELNGACNLGQTIYNGVRISSGTSRFGIDRTGFHVRDLSLIFDYSDYEPRNRHGGPLSGELELERLQYDRGSETTEIVNLTGEVWPGPLLRLADARTSAYIEELLGFRQPPTMSASGRFDHSDGGNGTLMNIRIEAPGVTDYEFLGKTLQLANLSADIASRENRHDVTALNFQTFQGTGAGVLSIREAPQEKTLIEGGIRWDNLSLSEISKKFSFEKEALGAITGRLDFTTLGGDTRTLNGKGVVGLKNGQLFNVPIFGPLSLPLGTILGKEYSHEQARDASATFVLRNGTAFTKDFLTSTPSTTFVGEGFIDLSEKQVDLTMRMNARGLLGLVTLPLAPLRGLFQFRGQGPLNEPVWRSAPFTEPDGGSAHPIFKDPPRAQIIPER